MLISNVNTAQHLYLATLTKPNLVVKIFWPTNHQIFQLIDSAFSRCFFRSDKFIEQLGPKPTKILLQKIPPKDTPTPQVAKKTNTTGRPCCESASVLVDPLHTSSRFSPENTRRNLTCNPKQLMVCRCFLLFQVGLFRFLASLVSGVSPHRFYDEKCPPAFKLPKVRPMIFTAWKPKHFEPKNGGLEDVFSLPGVHSQVPC